MGVLVGKGGLYGNVSTHFRDINIILVLCLCRCFDNLVLFPLDEYHSRYTLIRIQIISGTQCLSQSSLLQFMASAV